MVRKTGEGDDGSIGSYWATSHMSLSPSEDEKAPMPELSLSAEIVVGEQNSMQQQKSNGISKSKLKQGWDFLRTNQKAARPKKRKNQVLSHRNLTKENVLKRSKNGVGLKRKNQPSIFDSWL